MKPLPDDTSCFIPIINELPEDRKWIFETKEDEIHYAIWSDNVILKMEKCPYILKRFPISIRRVDEIDFDIPADVRGLYYNLLPIQDRINNCHLRAIHMMGTNKLLFESDAVDDAEDFIEQYSQDSATVEVRAGAIKDNKIKDIKQYNEIASLKAEIVLDPYSKAKYDTIQHLTKP